MIKTKTVLAKSRLLLSAIGAVSMLALVSPVASAADYVIDTKGAHAFVQFRVKHLGYSWLYGRFNSFEGQFSYDPAKPEANSITVTVDMTSLDTNHAERDTHLAAEKYLHLKKHTASSFKSTAYKATGDKTGVLTGNLTFLGVTKPISIDVEHIGGGSDPWGGYRQGFEGRATITPKDFGLDLGAKLGEAAATVELMLSVEGIRK